HALRIAQDDRLTASEIESCRCRLVRHPAREPQHVRKRGVLGRVWVEPGAAQGRAERGRVDCDDRAQAAGPIAEMNDLFVLLEVLEDRHAATMPGASAGRQGPKTVRRPRAALIISGIPARIGGFSGDHHRLAPAGGAGLRSRLLRTVVTTAPMAHRVDWMWRDDLAHRRCETAVTLALPGRPATNGVRSR